MWSEFKPMLDERSEEEKARKNAWRLCGIFLRDYYLWMSDKASSPQSWRTLPSWAEKIPLDVSYILRALDDVSTSRHDLTVFIDHSAKRVAALSAELEFSPDAKELKSAIDAYLKLRRSNANREEDKQAE